MHDLDTALLINRILDKFYEGMRPHMSDDHRDRLDALTPDARRQFTAKQMAKLEKHGAGDAHDRQEHHRDSRART